MKIYIPLLGSLLLLTGCIVSSEYKELWNSGTVDTNMVGLWEWHNDQQSLSVRIGISSNAYDIYVTNTHGPFGDASGGKYSYSFSARDVIIGTNLFLLCPSLRNAWSSAWAGTNNPALAAKEDNATLLRYARHEGGLLWYTLDSPAIQIAIDREIIKGKTSPPPDPTFLYCDFPQVNKFDSDTLTRLAEILSRDNSWNAPTPFTKKSCEQSVPGAAPQSTPSPDP